MVSTLPKITRTKPRKFFVMSDDYRGGGKGPGLSLVNEKALTTSGMMGFYPPIGQRGFYEPLPETPHVAQIKGRRPVRDLESLGRYWMISQKAKKVFEEVDAEGFAFVPCDFTPADGSKDDQRYLCDVIRELDAIDEARSEVRIQFDQGEKQYWIAGGANLAFDENKVAIAHVFKQVGLGELICDSILRDACKTAALKGLMFENAFSL